ncbi:hypothetical protein CERSUDRAFT_99712 [Gelatoporia subvermispora B]|uniref:Uncharacterized protein n=1 Tax=Ceriporiopsis subvermispora (strain B) TaxID=914234 RepID=M2P9A9_CERS8|nr:hypothetical protein CERSUDRAFT_99712 [Gelatoporia subvermispora B]
MLEIAVVSGETREVKVASNRPESTEQQLEGGATSLLCDNALPPTLWILLLLPDIDGVRAVWHIPQSPVSIRFTPRRLDPNSDPNRLLDVSIARQTRT